MNTTKKNRDPRTCARELLLEFGINTAPVPVDYIAEQQGITLRYVQLQDKELSGMIFMNEDTPVIAVNSLHHPNRQRFTISHELGHFALHMADIGSEIHVDKKFFAMARNAKSAMGFDTKEIEANRFAAELLVPRNMLLSRLNDRVIDIDDVGLISEMAKTFQVSAQMMSIRIGELLQ